MSGLLKGSVTAYRRQSWPSSLAQARRLSRRMTWLLGITLCTGLVWSASAAMRTPLKDQFGAEHRLSEKLGGKPLVVVAGDKRESRHAMKDWAAALSKPMEGQAVVLGLAELDDVPFFIPNSTITSKLVEQFPRLPVLCDWDNAVYEAIGFSDDRLVAVGVYDRQGKLRGVVTGKFTAERLQRVLTLRKLAEQPSQEG